MNDTVIMRHLLKSFITMGLTDREIHIFLRCQFDHTETYHKSLIILRKSL